MLKCHQNLKKKLMQVIKVTHRDQFLLFQRRPNKSDTKMSTSAKRPCPWKFDLVAVKQTIITK